MTDQSVSVRQSAIEQKTAAILDAARTVFSREGYEPATMDAVAAEAGIAKGTLYLYFKSKEELYLAALARDIRYFAGKAWAEMDRTPRFKNKMEAYLRVRLEYSRKYEDFLRIYLAEHGGMFIKSPVCMELRRIARDNLRHLATAVEEAIANREIRKVPAAPLAAAIGDIAKGLIERRLLGWKEFQVDDEVAFAASLLWRGIERPAKAAKAK